MKIVDKKRTIYLNLIWFTALILNIQVNFKATFWHRSPFICSAAFIRQRPNWSCNNRRPKECWDYHPLSKCSFWAGSEKSPRGKHSSCETQWQRRWTFFLTEWLPNSGLPFFYDFNSQFFSAWSCCSKRPGNTRRWELIWRTSTRTLCCPNNSGWTREATSAASAGKTASRTATLICYSTALNCKSWSVIIHIYIVFI